MRSVTMGKPVQFRGVFAGFAALLALSATAFGTNAATADSVQVQSYQRGSATEACHAQPGETPWQASWGVDSSWSPSWEQWANGGEGGWTCTRSITWARTPVAASSGGGSLTYRVGDTGPGGGLVFYIDSSSGLRYEMAPNTWGTGETIPLSICTNYGARVSGRALTAIGTGAANTAALVAHGTCNSTAANAVMAYPGTDSSEGQWFIPSLDELNAMCNYSRDPGSPAPVTDVCSGKQEPDFASGLFGFSSHPYWSSSSASPGSQSSWFEDFEISDSSRQDQEDQDWPIRVRPIRAF